MFGYLFSMTDTGWKILFTVGTVFIILTIGNEIVWRNFDEIMGGIQGYSTFATIIFALYQFTLARKYRLPNELMGDEKVVTAKQLSFRRHFSFLLNRTFFFKKRALF